MVRPKEAGSAAAPGGARPGGRGGGRERGAAGRAAAAPARRGAAAGVPAHRRPPAPPGRLPGGRAAPQARPPAGPAPPVRAAMQCAVSGAARSQLGSAAWITPSAWPPVSGSRQRGRMLRRSGGPSRTRTLQCCEGLLAAATRPGRRSARGAHAHAALLSPTGEHAAAVSALLSDGRKEGKVLSARAFWRTQAC